LNPALIIFIKNPKKGKVKTRLAKTLGENQALLIYKALLQHTRNIALQINATCYLFYGQFIDNEDDWSEKNFQKRLQTGADLGARMQRAFHEVLQKHDKAIIIGSDCATLTPDMVNDAFSKLEKHSFVIGPAEDGGYYLLGMQNYTPSVFENMEWSTESVFKETIQKIENLNKEYYLLPTLSDIDNEEDWEKHGWKI